MTIPTSQVMAYKANSGNLYHDLEECLLDNVYYAMYQSDQKEFIRIKNTRRLGLINFITLATNDLVLDQLNYLKSFYMSRSEESSDDIKKQKLAVNKVLYNINYVITCNISNLNTLPVSPRNKNINNKTTCSFNKGYEGEDDDDAD